MKKYQVKIKILLAFALIIIFVLIDTGLNYTLYNPAFITPIYGFFLKEKIISSEEAGYPLENIHDINTSKYSGPRATIIGTVIDVLKSGDGDWHITIRGKGGDMVTEIAPEYPLPIPLLGEKIRIWGVTRYDIAHRWWEIHPVFGWQKIS